jgi:uncharacterized repeat protein (TIGR01451 family)
MYHAIWKLTALAVVVAVGVVVVIQAQRGMQEGESGTAKEVAAASAEEGDLGKSTDLFDTAEPPSQGEPEVAAADSGPGDVVPVAAKTRPASGVAAIATDDEIEADDATEDEAPATPARKNSAPGIDPFADLDAEIPPNPKRRAAGKSSSLEEPDDLAGDLTEDEESVGPAVESKAKALPRSPEKSGPAKTRGPVLMLDAPDEELDPEKFAAEPEKKAARQASRPQLLGGSEEMPKADIAAKSKEADPFADDDEEERPAAATKAARKIADDDVEEAVKDNDSPPARLPQPALHSKPKPVAPDPFQDDGDGEEPLELPAAKEKRPAPERLPAADDDAEEADDMSPAPPRSVKPLLPEPAHEPVPRELEFPHRKPTGSPALPGADEPAIADPPAEPVKPELPQLTIEKVAPPTAVLGRPMVYQIVVRNTGEIPAHQVVVEDVIPDGVRMDGSIPRAQLKEDRLIWNLGTVPAGRSKKIAVRVVPQSEGTIGSVATVNFSPLPGAADNPAAPRLKFDVEAPRKAAVGAPVEFNFRVKNIGAVPAQRVTIRDVLPAGLRHNDGDDLEYEIGSIAPGKTSEVKLTLIAAQAGPTVNRVVVTAEGNVSEAAEVQIDVAGPALAVSRNGPARLYPEKIGRYANTVTNAGGSEMTKISLVEIVPAGMEFVEAADGGAYNAAKRTVTWAIDRLGPAESKTVKVTLRSIARGAQISVVRAFDSGGTRTETIGTTQVAGVPALKIEIGELQALVEVGETIKVPVRIMNKGSDVATNVRVGVPVPSGMKFLSATGPGSLKYDKLPLAGPEGSPGATEIQFAPLGKIDARGVVEFELTFKGRAPGETHLEIHAQCDQMSEPIHSREPVTVALPE